MWKSTAEELDPDFCVSIFSCKIEIVRTFGNFEILVFFISLHRCKLELWVWKSGSIKVFIRRDRGLPRLSHGRWHWAAALWSFEPNEDASSSVLVSYPLRLRGEMRRMLSLLQPLLKKRYEFRRFRSLQYSNVPVLMSWHQIWSKILERCEPWHSNMPEGRNKVPSLPSKEDSTSETLAK